MEVPAQAPRMLHDVAARIHELREISGFSIAELARLTDTTEADCARYEAGAAEMPFYFVHKAALAFGVDIVDLPPPVLLYRYAARGGRTDHR